MKSFLLAFAILLSSVAVFAGISCTPNAATGNPGISPPTDSLPCIEYGVFYSQVIQIENFGSVSVATVNYLSIDSITNIPCGISYVTNPSNGVLTTGATGCINIYGTSYENVGQYKVNLYITISVTIPIVGTQVFQGEASSVLAQIENLTGPLGVNATYILRVINPSDPCPAINTGTTDVASTSCAPGSFTVNILGDEEVCTDSTTTLTLNITGGGTPPYTYSWTPSANLSAYSGATAGSYSVTVTDDLGTTSTASFTVGTTADPVAGFSYTVSGDTVSFVFSGTGADGGYYDFGDGDTAQHPSPVHVYTTTSTDTFSVTQYLFNECGVWDSTTQDIIISAVGIQNRYADVIDVSVFPNPVNNELTINLKGITEATYSIYTLQGALVREATISGASVTKIDMANQPAGTYLIMVKTSEGVAVKKVLKQ